MSSALFTLVLMPHLLHLLDEAYSRHRLVADPRPEPKHLPFKERLKSLTLPSPRRRGHLEGRAKDSSRSGTPQPSCGGKALVPLGTSTSLSSKRAFPIIHRMYSYEAHQGPPTKTHWTDTV